MVIRCDLLSFVWIVKNDWYIDWEDVCLLMEKQMKISKKLLFLDLLIITTRTSLVLHIMWVWMNSLMYSVVMLSRGYFRRIRICVYLLMIWCIIHGLLIWKRAWRFVLISLKEVLHLCLLVWDDMKKRRKRRCIQMRESMSLWELWEKWYWCLWKRRKWRLWSQREN